MVRIAGTLDYIPSQYGQGRRTLTAFVLSALVHLGLLIALRPPPVDSDLLNLLPDLRLFIDQPAERDNEREESAPVRRPAAPSRELTGVAAASAADTQTTDSAPPREPVVASGPATEPALIDDQDQRVGEAVAALDTPAAELVSSTVASTVASTERRVAPAPFPDTLSELPAPAVTPAERRMLSKQFEDWTRQQPDAELSPVRRSWKYRGHEYAAVVRRQPAVDDMAIERAEVEITTVQDGVQLHSRVQLQRLAFSHFTQLVDRWDPDVQLHDDEIVGRFHSNSELLIGWDRGATPRFLGQVTIATGGYTVVASNGARSRSVIFSGGLQTGARRIALPDGRLDLDPERRPGTANLRSFDRNTRIVFAEDGSFTFRPTDSSVAAQRQMLSPTPTYLLSRNDAVLYVQGTVRGAVLVYSPTRILITGTLRYARDPRRFADSPDVLGLISGGDIVIAASDEVGPGNLEIEAAVYARRRFRVTDANERSSSTLVVYGSLSAGSIAETEPRYATRVEFDPRFEHLRPPGFPLTNRYEVTEWSPQWNRTEDAGSR